jgi:hypothetical protein
LGVQVTRLVFANGYVIAVAQAARAESGEDAQAIDDSQTSPMTIASFAAPVVGLVAGALNNGQRGAGVGAGIGSVVGAVVAMIGFANGSDSKLEAGSPLELTLETDLVLNAERAALPAPARSPFVARRLPQKKKNTERSCFDPGSAGTPDVIVVPASPGSPAVGGTPGTPPTPAVTIPGTPAIQGHWYPCN